MNDQALDKASVEDEESLQEKWSALLANTSTGSARTEIKYINMLAELDADEVKLLDAVYLSESTSKKEGEEYIFSSKEVAKSFVWDISKVKLMVDNFYRMGICQSPAMKDISTGDSSGNSHHPILKTNNLFTFTDLGRAFVSSVKYSP